MVVVDGAGVKRLALDTATEACSVALDIDGEQWHRFVVAGREHSRHLPAMVQSIMAEAGLRMTQLDALVCGIGPGSFAGVRIGVAYAKGLAAGLDLPVTGVSSLAMLAQAAIRQHSATQILCAIDARMSQVYFGAYVAAGGLAQKRVPEAVCDPDQVTVQSPTLLAGDFVAVGSGWDRYGDTLQQTLSSVTLRQTDGAALPQARDALDLTASTDWTDPSHCADRLNPLYLRNQVALTRVEQAAARRKRG